MPHVRLSQEALEQIPQGAGVCWVLPAGGRWADGVPRVLGNDPSRILFYGCSSNLRARAGQFLESLAGPGPHAEGNRIRELNELNPHADLNTFILVWEATPDGEQEQHKAQLLHAYFARFGEVPPFNAALPG